MDGEEVWKTIDSKMKSTLTRKFNKSSFSSQALVREQGITVCGWYIYDIYVM